jgi:hypothetical protein
VDTATGIQDSVQAPRGFFEQARLPFLEVGDTGRQPLGSRLVSADRWRIVDVAGSVSDQPGVLFGHTRGGCGVVHAPAGRMPHPSR